MEILIGKGSGSDLVFTEVWWWDHKGSHNDFISLFINGSPPANKICFALLIQS